MQNSNLDTPLYCRTIGAGKDLVLLHGWGFSGALFDKLVQKYQSNYRISVIDLPGHGKSPVISGGLTAWCLAIIKVLPQNPILLGWSLGGLLAIKIAHQIPILRLILVATSPKFVQTDDWIYGIDVDYFKQFSNNLNLNLCKSLKRFVSLQSKDKTQLIYLNQAIEKYPCKAEALQKGLQILLTADLRVELQNLPIPVKAILGKYDTLVPAKIARWYQSQNIQTAVINSGHLPFIEAEFTLY